MQGIFVVEFPLISRGFPTFSDISEFNPVGCDSTITIDYITHLKLKHLLISPDHINFVMGVRT